MKKRILTLILIILSLIVLVGLYSLLFLRFKVIIPCIFHQITGFYCPGCGITRMIFSLLKLDFYQAFRFNPLIFIALPFIIVVLIDFVFKWGRGKDNYLYRKINDRVWIVLLIITIIFGIIRNIPFFEYLIPTVI